MFQCLGEQRSDSHCYIIITILLLKRFIFGGVAGNDAAAIGMCNANLSAPRILMALFDGFESMVEVDVIKANKITQH